MVKVFEDDFAVSIALNSIKISSFTIVEETMVVKGNILARLY